MILLVMLLVLTSTSAVEVNFTGDWKEGVGWELICSWRMPQGDRLQSVKLSRAGVLFKIYRPEIHASRIREDFHPAQSESWMHLDCKDEAQRGSCTLDVELLQPPRDSVLYTCEVSGERPRFMIVSRDFDLKPYVPSNDAHIETRIDIDKTTNRVLLNCSATGLPAPDLTWSVDQLKVQGDFTGKIWNTTTKLMHAWSTLALTPKPGEQLPVLCVPEQKTATGLALGPSAEYTLREIEVNAATTFPDDIRIGLMLVLLLNLYRCR